MEYKITASTNSYIAQRDIMFNGKTTVVIDDGLTLRDAQGKLLDLFNKCYDTSYPNWGLVRANYPHDTSSFSDGTRSFGYDSRYYCIYTDGADVETWLKA